MMPLAMMTMTMMLTTKKENVNLLLTLAAVTRLFGLYLTMASTSLISSRVVKLGNRFSHGSPFEFGNLLFVDVAVSNIVCIVVVIIMFVWESIICW